MDHFLGNSDIGLSSTLREIISLELDEHWLNLLIWFCFLCDRVLTVNCIGRSSKVIFDSWMSVGCLNALMGRRISFSCLNCVSFCCKSVILLHICVQICRIVSYFYFLSHDLLANFHLSGTLNKQWWSHFQILLLCYTGLWAFDTDLRTTSSQLFLLTFTL
jgi:uncharacterized membrane protein